MVANQTVNGNMVTQINQFLDQKLVPLSRSLPELIPEDYLTDVHVSVKTLFTEKIPNLNWQEDYLISVEN